MSYGHELEDCFVERAVQIVIRDNQAAVKYSFGLNEQTMSQLLESWDDDPGLTPDVMPAAAVNEADFGPVTRVFEELILSRLADSLHIEIDGAQVDARAVSLERSARHHYRYVANFRFQLPVSKSLCLSIRDDNFLLLDGAARYALKTAGSTMLMKSNTAPIIVRAKRYELSNLAPVKRAAICRIDATVAVLSPSPAEYDMDGS